MLQGTGVRRRLGVFILVMVLLVFIDWGIVLFFHFDAPPLYRLVILACPGNGFSAFCAPSGSLPSFSRPELWSLPCSSISHVSVAGIERDSTAARPAGIGKPI